MIGNELYQQVILEHSKKPRNFGKLEPCSHVAEGFNPLCGDHLWVYINVDGDNRVASLTFTGDGCAISKASASMMTQAVKGKTITECRELFTEFTGLVKGELKPERDANQLGKLTIFSGIWQYPSRVKCAALAWHTLHSALNQAGTVSTE